ncbi:MAG TPA: hypothetical protein VEF05_10940 [Terriglobales bacterium]|nr:hypothetical protein [Terriglobales bacterium]
MHSRLVAITLALYLSFTVFGCTKKTDQSQTADQTAANAPAPAPAPKTEEPRKPRIETVTIPEGTSLTVRLGEAVGSKISQPGQSFSATLADAVEVGGKTVIPAGAAATGTVVDAKPLGRFKGGALLSLQLTSITVHGTEHQIQTSAVSQTEKGKGKRTAVLAGGGAGLGALIGGLTGGGKGAAIGAAAGAGAGGAGAAFTGNKEIVMPAESAVTFKLSQSLEVKEKE